MSNKIEVQITFKAGFDQTMTESYIFAGMKDLALYVTAFIGAENLISMTFNEED